jgi:branched-chain amino acid transport system substrate-binding protein
MNRRQVLTGGASAAVLAAALGLDARRAEAAGEVVIGAIYPLSGASADVGLQARNASETAAEIINNSYDFDLVGARAAGLSGLGGAKVRLVYADHQADPEKGRSEAERLITENKVSALIGCYYSTVSATVSYVAERYGVPFLCADSSSPALSQHKLKYFFRPGPDDEMFSAAMFDFFDAERAKGKKIDTLGLFHEDTIFGTDSAAVQRKLAQARGYKVVVDIKYQANSPSLTSEVQTLKAANPDVLMPSSYTSDAILLVKTMAQLGYQPKNIVAQAAGFASQALYDAVGKMLNGVISRASFSLDLTKKRPFIAAVNDLFRKRSQRDLDDNSARELMGLLVLADGINRAGATDGARIRAALAATNIPGSETIMPWKKVIFSANGQNPDANPVLLQYVGGKFVTIFPDDVAVAPVIWPMHA